MPTMPAPSQRIRPRRLAHLRLLRSPTAACACALLFAACGGGDDSGTPDNGGKGTSTQPVSTLEVSTVPLAETTSDADVESERTAREVEPVIDAVQRLRAALGETGCASFNQFGHSGSSTPYAVAQCSNLRKDLKGFTYKGARSYGTVAIVDFTAVTGTGALVFAADAENNKLKLVDFEPALDVPESESRRTQPIGELQSRADAALRAYAARDCELLAVLAVEEAQEDLRARKKSECLVDNPTQQALAQSGSGTLVNLGTTTNYAFLLYDTDTSDFTVVMKRQTSADNVFGIYEAPAD